MSLKTVLIGPFTATRVPGGVGMRLRALYRALNQPGHRCSFIPVAADQFGCAAGCDLSEHRSPGDPFAAAYCPKLLARLVREVRYERPDAVIVSNLQLHRYLCELASLGEFPIAFDMHNVEYDLMRAMLEHVPAESRHAMGMDAAAEALRDVEAHAVAAADQVWVCADTDRVTAENLYAPINIIRVPNVAAPSAQHVPETPAHAVFTGRFDYYPNVDAYGVLAGQIAPLIPHVPIVVAGAGMDGLAQLGPPPGNVRLMADPENVLPLIAAGVMVVPLRLGGGTRLKVLEALAIGAPVVSTGKGVEGLDLVDGTHFARAETPDQFAAAIDRTLTDSPLRTRLREHGREIVTQRYSPSALARIVRECLSEMLSPTRSAEPAGRGFPR